LYLKKNTQMEITLQLPEATATWLMAQAAAAKTTPEAYLTRLLARKQQFADSPEPRPSIQNSGYGFVSSESGLNQMP
jgi:hypothetical protein